MSSPIAFPTTTRPQQAKTPRATATAQIQEQTTGGDLGPANSEPSFGEELADQMARQKGQTQDGPKPEPALKGSERRPGLEPGAEEAGKAHTRTPFQASDHHGSEEEVGEVGAREGGRDRQEGEIKFKSKTKLRTQAAARAEIAPIAIDWRLSSKQSGSKAADLASSEGTDLKDLPGPAASSPSLKLELDFAEGLEPSENRNGSGTSPQAERGPHLKQVQRDQHGFAQSLHAKRSGDSVADRRQEGGVVGERRGPAPALGSEEIHAQRSVTALSGVNALVGMGPGGVVAPALRLSHTASVVLKSLQRALPEGFEGIGAPRLALSLSSHSAQIRLDGPSGQALIVELRVRDRNVEVHIRGEAAALLPIQEHELRASLASRHINLGRFELGESQAGQSGGNNSRSWFSQEEGFAGEDSAQNFGSKPAPRHASGHSENEKLEARSSRHDDAILHVKA